MLRFDGGRTRIMEVPGDMTNYLSIISDIPVLTREQELKLTKQLGTNRRKYAIDQLVMHNLRFVTKVARQYDGYGLAFMDLVQEGTCGLINAAEKFDYKQETRFLSFATYSIKGAIHEYIIKNWKIIKVAASKSQRKLFFNYRRMRNNGSTLDEIASELNVSDADVFEMDQRMSGTDFGFNQDYTAFGYNVDADYNGGIFAADELLDDQSDPSVLYDQSDYGFRSRDILNQEIQKLDPRSRDIIRSRHLSEHKMTLRELSDVYSVSPERIRQIEDESLTRIKQGVQSANEI